MSIKALLDHKLGVERTLVVRHELRVLVIGRPLVADDELVLVLARGELDGRGVDAVLLLERHLLSLCLPVREGSRQADILSSFGVHGERDALKHRL